MLLNLPFMRRWRTGGVFLILPLAASLAGCTSTRLEEAMPEAVAPAAPVAESVATGALSEGALQQMTEEERDAYLAEIESARAGQVAPGRARQGADTSELRAIAREHASEALQEIEGE